MLDHRPHMALLHYYHSYAVPITSEEDALTFFCFQLLSPHSTNGVARREMQSSMIRLFPAHSDVLLPLSKRHGILDRGISTRYVLDSIADVDLGRRPPDHCFGRSARLLDIDE